MGTSSFCAKNRLSINNELIICFAVLQAKSQSLAPSPAEGLCAITSTAEGKRAQKKRRLNSCLFWLISVALINNMIKITWGEMRLFCQMLLGLPPALREVRAETGAEDTEKRCLPLSNWLSHAAQRPLSWHGTMQSGMDPPVSISDQESTPWANLTEALPQMTLGYGH